MAVWVYCCLQVEFWPQMYTKNNPAAAWTRSPRFGWWFEVYRARMCPCGARSTNQLFSGRYSNAAVVSGRPVRAGEPLRLMNQRCRSAHLLMRGRCRSGANVDVRRAVRDRVPQDLGGDQISDQGAERTETDGMRDGGRLIAEPHNGTCTRGMSR